MHPVRRHPDRVLIPVRASERDRLRTIAGLKRGYVQGQLSTRTFEARIAVAQASTSRAVLRSLLGDLQARWLALNALTLFRPDQPAAAVQLTVMVTRSPTDRVVIGRSRSCDIVVDAAAVSRRHAVLDRTSAGDWRLTDLESTNGTFVDGVRVNRAPVHVGAALRLGDAELHLA